MDAKFPVQKSFALTGTQLFLLLAGCMSAAAVTIDGLSGRSPYGLESLTLPLVTAAAVTAAIGSWVVPMLRRLKTGQVIREDGPQSHFVKAGTPTMGGIFFVPTAVVLTLFLGLGCDWSGSQWADAIAVCALTLSYGFIGWLDDWQVLRRKSNKGITPRQKLTLQVVFGLLFCLWIAFTKSWDVTTLALPLGASLPLGLVFFPIGCFTLVAESNATNLTDGLDGLAGGTGAIAMLSLGAIVQGVSPALGLFCASLAGACLGFLVYNRNPARVFMGDTGSLALGGALAAVALLSHSLWSLVIVGGVFLAETLSVVLQVSYYKATKGPDGKGKRLFKMAPLHHHFELSGWSELQVVTMFYLAAAALGALGLWLR